MGKLKYLLSICFIFTFICLDRTDVSAEENKTDTSVLYGIFRNLHTCVIKWNFSFEYDLRFDILPLYKFL